MCGGGGGGGGSMKELWPLEEIRIKWEALASEDDVKWRNAMQKEIESLHSNDVWDLVELNSSG